MKAADYRAVQAAAMSEDELLDNILVICRQFGLLAYHTFDSRRSQAGFPDLVIVGLGGIILFRELKRENGRLTVPQRTWLDRLAASGGDAAVWRPSQLVDGTILEQLKAVA